MASIYSLNVDTGIVYIKALPGEDLTGWTIVSYTQKGNGATPQATFTVETTDPFQTVPNDGFIYYQQQLQPLSSPSDQRSALVLVDDTPTPVDEVGWGKDDDFPLVGGPGGGIVIDPGNGNYAPGDGPWYTDGPPWATSGPPPLAPVPPPCFMAGTRIETGSGAVKVEELRVGQRVRTQDGNRKIVWIGSFALDLTQRGRAHMRPICFRADSLAQGVPSRDTWFSPQHRIYIEQPESALFFGAHGVLAAAKHLVDGTNVFVDTHVKELTYYHILLDGHHILSANGMAAESLLLTDHYVSRSALAAHTELQEFIAADAEDASQKPKYPVLKAYEASLMRTGKHRAARTTG